MFPEREMLYIYPLYHVCCICPLRFCGSVQGDVGFFFSPCLFLLVQGEAREWGRWTGWDDDVSIQVFEFFGGGPQRTSETG